MMRSGAFSARVGAVPVLRRPAFAVAPRTVVAAPSFVGGEAPGDAHWVVGFPRG